MNNQKLDNALKVLKVHSGYLGKEHDYPHHPLVLKEALDIVILGIESPWTTIIDESLPKTIDEENPYYVLITDGYRVGLACYMADEETTESYNWYDELGEVIDPPPIYWMPIPILPKIMANDPSH